MSQYETLDRMILQRLEGEDGVPLGRLFARGIYREACRLASLSGREEFRVLDGRLQALRKAGKIVHDYKRGWRLV